MSIDSSSPLPQEITNLITTKAKRLVGRYRFTETDQEDIEQKISLEVVRKRSTVSQARAQNMGFLICLVNHAVADIIAARKASNRDYRREEGSLDEWVENGAGGWVRRGDAISEEDARLRLGRPGMSQEELRDLAIDMADAAASLPRPLRKVYKHLKKLGSVQEVAKATGVHRSTVYDALKEIKRHFEQASLDSYSPRPHPTNPTDRVADS